MPHETIYPPNPPGFTASGTGFATGVAWGRDRDEVQVGVGYTGSNGEQYHLVDAIYGDPDLLADIGSSLVTALKDQNSSLSDALRLIEDGKREGYACVGRQVLDAVTGSTPAGTAVWADLDRRGVNALIKLLRRARTAAFGQDE